ncbi:hypothetical protein HanPI659440_Chr16g0636141 [Helianthus annuus]|nr:hypothetical protein HanPI659440_Chr16g0636141 [Helianthus annuus]
MHFPNHNLRKKILFMGNTNFFSGKTGYDVADSPACPDITGLPLRLEPGKKVYNMSNKGQDSLNSIMT